MKPRRLALVQQTDSLIWNKVSHRQNRETRRNDRIETGAG